MKRILAAAVVLYALLLYACARPEGVLNVHKLDDFVTVDVSSSSTEDIIKAISNYVGKEPVVDGEFTVWDNVQTYFYHADIVTIKLRAPENDIRVLALYGPTNTKSLEDDLDAYVDDFLC